MKILPSVLKQIIAFIGVLLIIVSCNSNTNDKQLKFNEPSPRGYSQSVEYNLGNSKMLFISGQVAVNENGEIEGINDLQKQTEQVFKNIQTLVEKSGGSMNGVVKIEAFFIDLSKIDQFRKAIFKYFDPKKPPSCTVVQVERLVNKAFLIEINAVAIIDNH